MNLLYFKFHLLLIFLNVCPRLVTRGRKIHKESCELCMNSELECVFDWLQFTIKDMEKNDVILQVLKMNIADFTELPKGRYGYKAQCVYGNIHVLYDGMEDMGIHVMITGQGCRQYEAIDDILKLLDRVMLHDGRCSRIDLAVDDKTGNLIKYDEMQKAILSGYLVTKWKTNVEYCKRDSRNGEIIGRTIMFGSGKSKFFMRVYDKALEQGVPGTWYRMELEIKDDRAENLQNILLFEDEIGGVIAGILNTYIRFVLPGADKNKSRWKNAPWWDRLISQTRKVRLTRQPDEKGIEDVREWIKRQIGPTLAMLILYDEGELTSLFNIIKSGKDRLKAKHLKMLKSSTKGESVS